MERLSRVQLYYVGNGVEKNGNKQKGVEGIDLYIWFSILSWLVYLDSKETIQVVISSYISTVLELCWRFFDALLHLDKIEKKNKVVANHI